MTTEKKKFALVKWVSGEYENTFTPGIPIEWIRDFNLEEFDPETEDEDISYVVEWRENRKGKRPKMGWKCFDAKVIMVSSSKKHLNEKLVVMEGEASPLKITKKIENENQDDRNKRKLEDRFNEDLSLPGSSAEISVNQEDNTKKIRNKKQTTSPIGDESLTGEDGEDRSTPKDQRKLYKLLKRLSKDVQKIQNSQKKMHESRYGTNDEAVEIGHEGSGVFVTYVQWRTARSQKSHQAMARSLVLALFSPEVLLQSNLRGGASKIDVNSPRRPGLDPSIINAIEEAVTEKFPDEFKRTTFGLAINNMLTDMRRKNGLRAVARLDDQ